MKSRHVALALPALLALGACSEPDPTYEGITPAEFATAACSGWANWYDVEVAAEGTPDELTGSGEEQKAQAIEVAEGMLAALQQSRGDIAGAQPAVEDGPEIVGFFTAYYDSRIEVAEARIDKFRDFPTELGPNEDNIVVEAIDLFYDLGEYGPEQSAVFPFAEIENQDVIQAIDDEPTCDEFVMVR